MDDRRGYFADECGRRFAGIFFALFYELWQHSPFPSARRRKSILGCAGSRSGSASMDQLKDLLGGADVALDDAILDRIDQIVPPGVTLDDADAGWQPPALPTHPSRRLAALRCSPEGSPGLTRRGKALYLLGLIQSFLMPVRVPRDGDRRRAYLAR